MSKPKVNNDGSALQRRYSPDQLRDIFAFCQRDFDRFIELLLWLEELDAND